MVSECSVVIRQVSERFYIFLRNISKEDSKLPSKDFVNLIIIEIHMSFILKGTLREEMNESSILTQ